MGVAGSFDRPGRLDGVAGASSTGLTFDLRRERLRGVVVTALLSGFSADGSATGASSFVAARNSSRVSVMTFAIIRANASTAAAFGTLHSAVFDASFSGSASMNSLGSKPLGKDI